MNRPALASTPLPLLACGLLALWGCATRTETGWEKTGKDRDVPHKGDEIVVAGQLFHTGTPVVLWFDPGGFNAYKLDERSNRDAPRAVGTLAADSRFGVREGLATNAPGRAPSARSELAALQQLVDQFVIHYDAIGVSSATFQTLNNRGLSVHFLLDLDGAIYQTLDLRERAFHATTSNNRSVGIEIANIGAFETTNAAALLQWYGKDSGGRAFIAIPGRFGPRPERAPGFIGRPARNDPVEGEIQGKLLRQYDFTPEQYEALAHLTAALSRVFPKMRLDCPRDAAGHGINRKLPDDVLARYQGVLGHFHIQTNKIDPGPAFQWDRVIPNARKEAARPAR